MNQRIFLMRPPANPVLQVLYFALGGVLLVAALLMGAVILSIALGVAFIVGLVVWARIWWLRRNMSRGAYSGASGTGPTRPNAGRSTEVIDVEYTVVDERDDRRRD